MKHDSDGGQARLFLLDGMALVYRAHFAFLRNPVMNSQGVNTSAVLGFANTLLQISEAGHPTHWAVAFDTRAPTFRHECFAEYKAQREAMPEELAVAIPLVKRLCEALRVPVLEVDGYEADDVIGTLARQAEEAGGYEAWMVTPDKDFAQLVSETTRIWKPGRKGQEAEVLGLAEVCEAWGVEHARQVVDVLALWGDASDNIPGVPGIGEKTAKKLVGQFGGVEGLLGAVDQLKGKQKENVMTHAEQARLSRRLAEICREVPLEVKLEDLAVREMDDEAVRGLFQELEFRSLAKRVFGQAEGGNEAELHAGKGEAEAALATGRRTLETENHHYRYLKAEDEVTQLATQLSQVDRFCFDLETVSLDRFENEVLGIAFAWKSHEAVYVELREHPEWLELLRPALEGPAVKVGHNLKFDVGVLYAQGLMCAGPFFDTMLVHALLEPRLRHGMDRLAEDLLGYQTKKLTELPEADAGSRLQEPSASEGDLFDRAREQKSARQKGQKSLDMKAIDPAALAEYAAEDADVTWQLAEILREKLRASGMEGVYADIEGPLLPVLVRMEAEGMTLDEGALSKVGQELTGRLDETQARIWATAGQEFNLASPKQLGDILFGEMQLVAKPKKTKTGQYKTDEQTLAALASEHQIVADILTWREAAKLKSTYIDALPEHVHPRTGRVHTHLHQLIASTGRMASSDPNLQNIPVRSDLGRRVRKAFVPRGPDYVLFSADYSQVELRVMAALSGDEGLISAFRNGADIHAATAARVYGVGEDEVLPEMRRTAKMVNFGIIYGISAFGLSQRLGVPRGEAAELIKSYFAQYPKVKLYMEETLERAREDGFVQTLCGRKSERPDLLSRNATVRANAERAAINAPIQGTAADLMKLAMIQVDRLLQDGHYQTRMLLQVHDELLFDLAQEEQELLIPQIIEAMEGVLTLPHGVPLVAEGGIGSSWLEAH